MAYDWFRMHNDARLDKKLGKLTDSQYRVWHSLLCFASEQRKRGKIEYDDMELLALEVSREDVGLLTETIERLAKLKIIKNQEGCISFINWNKRQYDKPSDAPEAVAERVGKHRAAQAGERYQADEGVTTAEPCDGVTPCNAQKRLDTDTDSESESDAEHTPPFPPSGGDVRAGEAISSVGEPDHDSGSAPTASKEPGYPAAFEAFWEAYPQKVGKKAAFEAWRRIKPDKDMRTRIMSAIADAGQSDRWQRGYIPNPTTWLNQGRWDDVPSAAPVPNGNGTRGSPDPPSPPRQATQFVISDPKIREQYERNGVPTVFPGTK